jgi:alkyl hydroperoxide reductase subunit AhpC
MNRISQFGTTLQIRCTSTEDLRNFWSSYRQFSRYHMTVCQVNMDTHAVHLKTHALRTENPNLKYQAEIQSF